MFVLHQMIITTGPQSTSLPRRSSCPHLLMRMMSILLILIVAISPIAAAVVETNSMPQTSSAATSTDCDCAPSVLWPVLLTLLAVLIAAGASYLFWRYYWSVKHGKHLVLVTDLEKGSNEFAFDNPGFKEGSPIIAKKTQDEKKTRWIAFNENSSSAKMGNGKSQTAAPYGSISNSTKVEEQKQQNLSPSEPPSPSGTSVVPLKSRDFTGLGFNIRGNMRDGIFIKDLLHRGPASESGHIKPGDRIAAVRINFSHMVYEDAIAILSYASPYEVEIEIDQNATWLPGSLKNDKSKVDNNISHPFYRSQSFSDIQQIQKDESLMNGSKTTVSSPTSPETIIKPPAILQVSSEAAASERMPKYGGVKVLPDMNKEFQMVTEQKRNREHCVLSIDEVDNREKSISSTVAASSNSSNSVAAADFDEIDLTGGEKDEHENNNNRNNNNRTSTTNNVKSIIVKGIQNIKDKINNHIQQRNNSGSKIKSSSEKSSLEKDQINHLHHTKEEEESSQAAINKRKAPLPPASTASERDITEDNNNGGSSSLLNEIDRQVVKKSNYTDNSSNFPEKIADNNNATNNNHSTVRLNASQITVHQYPNNSNNNDESDRKSASLGDLSTESATVVVAATSVLERAVSLELAETPQKKRRKAPMPPDDDAISDDDIAYYGKDGINGGSTILEVVVGSPGNRLKKSTVFGTMEEAVKQSSEDDDSVSILSIPDDDSLIASTPMMKNNHRWQVDEDIFLDPIEDELPVIPPDLPKSPVPDLPPKSAYVTEITVLNDNDDKYNNAARTDTTLFVTALESPSLSSPSSSSTSSSESMTQHDVTSAAVVAGNDESADVTIKKNQSIDVDKSSESDRIVNGGEQSITTNDNVNIIGGGVSELGDDRELPKINSYEIVNYRQEPPTVVNQRDDDSSNKELFLSSEGGGDISKKRKSMADNNGNFSTEIFQSSKKTINLKYPSKITDNNNNNHHHHHNHKANNSMTNGGKIIKSSPSPAAVYYKTTKSISTNGSNGQHNNNNGGVGGKIGSRIPVRANTEPNLKFSLLTAKEDDTNTTGKAGKKHITTTTTGTNEKKLSSAYSTHNLSAKKSLSPIRVNGSNNIAR